MSNKIKDYTCNGKCSNCGNCCIPWVPITDYEYTVIKNYIKEHDIKPQPIQVSNNDIYLDCCFHDRINKKCMIYEVRPEVCSNFICSSSKEKINKDREHYDNRANINGSTGRLMPLDLLFYNRLDTLIGAVAMFLNDKKLKFNAVNISNILNSFGYSDKEIESILKAIKIKED